MNWYIKWVSANILLSAFIQFAILGTLGEVLGILVAKRKPSNKAIEWLLKAVVWGFLGILVKYSFTGFTGFLSALIAKGFWSHNLQDIAILRALSLSILTNSMFGPLLMFLHRTTDNLICKVKGYAGIEKSLATLAWFWVPAHTVTFALPYEYQLGLAALWSVALGIIMGFTKRK